MKKHLLTASALITALFSIHTPVWSKEPIGINFNFSDPQTIPGESYQTIVINSYAIQAFCKDSIENSVVNSILGRSKNASLLITLDKIPVLNISYNGKDQKCTLQEIRNKALNGQSLSSSTKPNHLLSLVYASEEKIDAINNLISVAKTALGAEANILSAPMADMAKDFLTKAYEQAAKSGIDYTSDFDIPGAQTEESKALLQGTVPGKKTWDLLSFKIITKQSILDNYGYGPLMNQTISGGRTPNQILGDRRSTEGGTYKPGNLTTIKNECRLLSNKFQSLLTQYDMQRLLEAYLLTNHREYLTLNIIEDCLERKINSPTTQLTYKILGDEVIEPLSKYDTHFLRGLRDGSAIKSKASFVDTSGELGISTTTEYISLKNASLPLCHTYITYNEAAFVQIINSKPYYVNVVVDKLYTQDEAREGKLSKVKKIYIYKTLDSLYEEKDGVRTCLNTELQRTAITKI